MIILNLLPPERKRSVVAILQAERWRPAMIFLVVAVVAAVGGLQAGLWQMNAHHQEIGRQLSALRQQAETTESGTVTDKITVLNETIRQLARFSGLDRRWTSDAADVLAAMPDGVTISSFSIDASGRGRLEGMAATRSSFLALSKALEGHTRLSGVTTSSSASKRDSIPFLYTFTFKPSS